MKGLEKQNLLSLCIVIGIVFFVLDDASSPVAIAQTTASVILENQVPTPDVQRVQKGTYEYLEIIEGCNYQFEGRCIYAYSGPGVEYKRVYDLRKGMIFKIKDKVQIDGQVWYRVHFDEWLRHPDRVNGDWYIPSVTGNVVSENGVQVLESKASTTKRVVVDLSDHILTAYDGDSHFMTTKVATGLEFTPTPTGTFTVYKKTPTRYMQGPIAGVSDVPFDLPGVPWNLYFTNGGAVIHGSYWHERYGTEQSSGCINLPPELAKILYDWADLGTVVIIQN